MSKKAAPNTEDKRKTAELVAALPPAEQADLLAQALLREYMHRKSFKQTLQAFDNENPRDERTISSRAVMHELLNIPVEGQPSRLLALAAAAAGGAKSAAPTFMEELCSYRLTKRDYARQAQGVAVPAAPGDIPLGEEDPSDSELETLRERAAARTEAREAAVALLQEGEQLVAAEEARQQAKKAKKKKKEEKKRKKEEKRKRKEKKEASAAAAAGVAADLPQPPEFLTGGMYGTAAPAPAVGSKWRPPSEGGDTPPSVTVSSGGGGPAPAAAASKAAKPLFLDSEDLDLDPFDQENREERLMRQAELAAHSAGSSLSPSPLHTRPLGALQTRPLGPAALGPIGGGGGSGPISRIGLSSAGYGSSSGLSSFGHGHTSPPPAPAAALRPPDEGPPLTYGLLSAASGGGGMPAPLPRPATSSIMTHSTKFDRAGATPSSGSGSGAPAAAVSGSNSHQYDGKQAPVQSAMARGGAVGGGGGGEAGAAPTSFPARAAEDAVPVHHDTNSAKRTGFGFGGKKLESGDSGRKARKVTLLLDEPSATE